MISMNSKKYLPFIVVIVLAVVVVGGIFIAKSRNLASNNTDDMQNVPDLPADQRPTLGLVPTDDGHYLNLFVDNIKVPGAESMDYELLWKATNESGVQTTQGTSSTVQLKGQTSYTDKLLLGSESSGKFRYDKDVSQGTLTLRFRNSTGKLLGKVATDFHLQTDTTSLASVDGSFKYNLDKSATGVWFVTMQSFGQPKPDNLVIFSNGWAIYSSDGKPHSGK
jgi:hypothetical protein